MRGKCRAAIGIAGLVLSVWLAAPSRLHAQQPSPGVDIDAPRVADIDFEGDIHFPRQQLLQRVRTRGNRRLFAVPGLNWWLWLYRLGDSGALGSTVGGALMSVGEEPALLDVGLLEADVERLRNLYQQEGYRSAEVIAEVDTPASGGSARITFHIDAGMPTYLRRVRFEGVDALTPEQRQDLARSSLLRSRRAEWIGPQSFVAENRLFSEPMLLEERRRILGFLRDRGYASISRDSIRALVFAERPDSFDVTFEIQPGERYRFGDVQYNVVGPEPASPVRTDTAEVGEGEVAVRIENESRLKPVLLYESLQFEPGQWYNQSRLLATKRRLEGSGVFIFTDILADVDGVETAPEGKPVLPHRIDLRTRPRHQIRFETFMLQRSGLLGAENEIGAGAGLTYENANLFGGGEMFRMRLSGSVAADVDSRLFTSAQTEINTSLTLPYLVRPFGRLDESLNLYDARTRLSFNLLTARRDNLNLIIRGRGSALFRLEAQHSATVTSWLDMVDLSISNPDTLSGFRASFLDRVIGEDGNGDPVLDPLQRAQILEDYTQPQINNALRYTLRSARVNPLVRDQGYSYEMAFEVGGNLPYLLDRYVFTQGDLEGSLPGLPFFGGDRESRLAYRRYARLLTDLRQYRPLGRGTVVAGKFIAGISHPIGQSRVVPFDRRFYAGGGSSVRGWGLRLLGPGSAHFGATGEEVTNILGGDVKLEAGVELRQTMFRNLLAADWLSTLFVDVGNVWFGPRNPGFGEAFPGTSDGRFRVPEFMTELGVGSGAGLRLAWDYLIIRLDVAYKVHDPARAGLLPDALRDPTIHFGIGHTF